MDLTSLFAWAIIVMVISFVVKMLIGFDLKKFLGELTIILFVAPLLFFLITSSHDAEAAISFLNWYVNMFADALPGIFVGEIVGSLAAAVTKGFKEY